MEFFQDFILSRLSIAGVLSAVLVALIYWAIKKPKQFKGIGLGLALGFFFIIVRLSIAEMIPATDAGVEEYLNGFQVFTATIFGVGIGIVVLLALHFGMNSRRSTGIQIAVYIAVLIILIFLTFISNPDIQKMIGIFSLAIGMTTLFALVLVPDAEDNLNIAQEEATGSSQQVQVPPKQPDPGRGGANPPGTARSTLNKIRDKQKDKFGRRR